MRRGVREPDGERLVGLLGMAEVGQIKGRGRLRFRLGIRIVGIEVDDYHGAGADLRRRCDVHSGERVGVEHPQDRVEQ